MDVLVLRMVIVMSALRIGVIRMKNKERYAKEIVQIVCDGSCVAVDKATGNPVSCNNIVCIDCTLSNKGGCKIALKEWAESEYIEKPVISKKDKVFLEYVKEEYKCIARNKNGELFLYRLTPYKEEGVMNWIGRNCSCLHLKYNVDLPMVKWSDEEPWLIEDLKKLEVVENYE